MRTKQGAEWGFLKMQKAMTIPDSMFSAYSWVEINIFMFAKRNTKNGVLTVTHQRIADEFGITRHKARHILDRLFSDNLLKRDCENNDARKFGASSAQVWRKPTADYQQVTTTFGASLAQDRRKFGASLTTPLDQRKHDFGESLIPYLDNYGKLMIRQFFDYWTETSPNGNKMRFEKEKTFEIPKRLARWNMNQNNYNNNVRSNEQRQQDERQQRLNEYAEVAASFARQAEEDLRSRSAENQEGTFQPIPC